MTWSCAEHTARLGSPPPPLPWITSSRFAPVEGTTRDICGTHPCEPPPGTACDGEQCTNGTGAESRGRCNLDSFKPGCWCEAILEEIKMKQEARTEQVLLG